MLDIFLQFPYFKMKNTSAYSGLFLSDKLRKFQREHSLLQKPYLFE